MSRTLSALDRLREARQEQSGCDEVDAAVQCQHALDGIAAHCTHPMSCVAMSQPVTASSMIAMACTGRL